MKRYWVNVRLRIGSGEMTVGRAIERPVGIRNQDDVDEICGSMCAAFRRELKVPDGTPVGVAMNSWQRFEEDSIEIAHTLAGVQ